MSRRKGSSVAPPLRELTCSPPPLVPPADLEAHLLTHPEIDDCGVIGVMSEEQATELPRAYVVPRGGLDKWSSGVERKRLEEEIVGWVAKSVSRAVQPC